MYRLNIYRQTGSRNVSGRKIKLYAAFMDLEKASDRVDRRAMWEVLRVCMVLEEIVGSCASFQQG